MKTPIQELIDELDEAIDLLKKGLPKDDVWQSHSQGMIMAFSEVRSVLSRLYILEEKAWIIAAYHFGWDDGANNYRPVSDVIYEDGEDFYNKKFNIKE